VPEFISQVPHDVINGQPLHYRCTPDGQYVLYSVGWDATDDEGVISHGGNQMTATGCGGCRRVADLAFGDARPLYSGPAPGTLDHPADAETVHHRAEARDQNVFARGIRTCPPSASAANARSASVSLGTESERKKPWKLGLFGGANRRRPSPWSGRRGSWCA